MDACYFVDILMKWFTMQLNPSSLCLAKKRKHPSGLSLSSKSSVKVYYFLSFKTPACQPILPDKWNSLSVLYVVVNVKRRVCTSIGWVSNETQSLCSFIVSIPHLIVWLDSKILQEQQMYTFVHKKQKCSFLKLKHKTNGELNPKRELGMVLLFSKRLSNIVGTIL